MSEWLMYIEEKENEFLQNCVCFYFLSNIIMRLLRTQNKTEMFQNLIVTLTAKQRMSEFVILHQ